MVKRVLVIKTCDSRGYGRNRKIKSVQVVVGFNDVGKSQPHLDSIGRYSQNVQKDGYVGKLNLLKFGRWMNNGAVIKSFRGGWLLGLLLEHEEVLKKKLNG